MINNLDGNDTLQALVQCRYDVLRRATALLEHTTNIPLVEQADAVPSLSALLTTSLEALKIAEEELRVQSDKLVAQRTTIDERTRYYRQLFIHAPLPGVVTDRHGTIQESNLAAAKLFRREAAHLERKPLAALLPRESRELFRKQLLLISNDGVQDWPLVLNRIDDVPITVNAAVQFVPDLGATRSGLLFWMLRVVAA